MLFIKHITHRTLDVFSRKALCYLKNKNVYQNNPLPKNPQKHGISGKSLKKNLTD